VPSTDARHPLPSATRLAVKAEPVPGTVAEGRGVVAAGAEQQHVHLPRLDRRGRRLGAAGGADQDEVLLAAQGLRQGVREELARLDEENANRHRHDTPPRASPLSGNGPRISSMRDSAEAAVTGSCVTARR
jgi:hypothetical protein